MPRMIRSRLTFANVISMIALSLSLGGVSYAAATLPKGSVGAHQLKQRAVTGGKLARRSVGAWALADNVRAAIRRGVRRSGGRGPRGVRGVAGKPGPRGAHGGRGPRGPVGPAGAAGPGAGLISYSGDAHPGQGGAKTALDHGGIEMKVDCVQDADTTRMEIYAVPDEDTLFQINVNDDHGTIVTDPQSNQTYYQPAEQDGFESNNFQIPLTGGAEQLLGGPEAGDGQYNRSVVTAIFSGDSGVMTANLVVLVDGDADTCEMRGTAVSAS